MPGNWTPGCSVETRKRTLKGDSRLVRGSGVDSKHPRESCDRADINYRTELLEPVPTKGRAQGQRHPRDAMPLCDRATSAEPGLAQGELLGWRILARERAGAFLSGAQSGCTVPLPRRGSDGATEAVFGFLGRKKAPVTINSLLFFFLSCPARLHLSLTFTRPRSLHPDPKPPRSSGKLGLDQHADAPSSSLDRWEWRGWRRRWGLAPATWCPVSPVHVLSHHTGRACC